MIACGIFLEELRLSKFSFSPTALTRDNKYFWNYEFIQKDCGAVAKLFKAPTLDFDQLAQDTQAAFTAGERKVDIFYKNTYPVVLRECSKIAFDRTRYDYDLTQVCLLLVYTWMSPSRLDKRVTWPQYQSACDPLSHMKHSGSCTAAEFNSAIALANDSVVGASKFLHFVAPHYFPIWDQHVARYCGFDYYTQYDSADVYVSYVGWLRSQPISEKAEEITAGLLGITPDGQQLRCKEFLLFQAGLKLKFGKQKPRTREAPGSDPP